MSDKVLHHICIQTNQYEKSLSFYIDIMAFQLVKETRNFHGRRYNTWMSLGTLLIEMQTPKNEELFNDYCKNSEGIVHFCFYVNDIKEEYQRLVRLGFHDFVYKNGEPIYRVENGNLFKLIAPEGTIIEVRDSKGI